MAAQNETKVLAFLNVYFPNSQQINILYFLDSFKIYEGY